MTNETYQLELYKEELDTLLWILDGNYDLPHDPEEQEAIVTDIHRIYSTIMNTSMTNETYQLELYKEEFDTLLWILDGNYDLPYDAEEQEAMEIDIDLIYSTILKLLG